MKECVLKVLPADSEAKEASINQQTFSRAMRASVCSFQVDESIGGSSETDHWWKAHALTENPEPFALAGS
jgi:hypothetical protein